MLPSRFHSIPLHQPITLPLISPLAPSLAPSSADPAFGFSPNAAPSLVFDFRQLQVAPRPIQSLERSTNRDGPSPLALPLRDTLDALRACLRVIEARNTDANQHSPFGLPEDVRQDDLMCDSEAPSIHLIKPNARRGPIHPPGCYALMQGPHYLCRQEPLYPAQGHYQRPRR